MSDMSPWVAIDWGTSNLRAWSFDGAGNQLNQTASDEGMGSLSPADYPIVLEKILANLGIQEPQDQLRILICGMAGAKQGWKEATYCNLPLQLPEIVSKGVKVPVQGKNYDITILPGAAQTLTGQEDVMRGEETQLLGLLQDDPNYSGTVAMPGTHSKWSTIENGVLTGFRTVMTGELFDIITSHSVLRHSMPAGTHKTTPDSEGFKTGLALGAQNPADLQSNLFKARAATLLSGRSSEWARDYLSGLLIGAEVATNAPNSPQTIPIVGSKGLTPLYCAALESLGHSPAPQDVTQLTIAGLKLAHAHITQN